MIFFYHAAGNLLDFLVFQFFHLLRNRHVLVVTMSQLPIFTYAPGVEQPLVTDRGRKTEPRVNELYFYILFVLEETH